MHSGVMHVAMLDALAIVLPQVCVGCNTGWMNRLEQRVQPILQSVLLGTPRGRIYTLMPARQATLATWAIKTSLLIAARKFRGTEHGWIPRDNLEWLYEHRDSDRPPPGVRVWIGELNAEIRVPSWAQAGCRFEAGHPIAHCGSFSVGYVLLQVYCCVRSRANHTPEAEARLAPKVPCVSRLQQIEPANSAFRWPPDSAFAIDELPAVGQRLREELTGGQEAD